MTPVLVTLGAAGVYLAIHQLPIPGIDPMLVPAHLALLTPAAALLCLRGVPAALGKAPGRGLLVAWLAVVALQSRLALGALVTGAPHAVVDWGMRFELVLLLTALGLGAVLWFLADLVSRRGLASGALVLFTVERTIAMVPEIYGQGLSVVHGDQSIPALLPYAALALAVSATCFAAARRPPTEGLLRPLDLALLPMVGTLPAALVALSPVRAAALGESVPWLVAGAAWVGAVWVLQRTRDNAPARLRLWAIVAVLAPPALVAWPVVDAVVRGERSVAQVVSGPLAGDERAEVTLLSEGGDAAADAPRLVARLDQLGVRATASARDGHILLQVEGAIDVDTALAAVLPRRHLSVRPVAEEGLEVRECDCVGHCKPRFVGAEAFDSGVVHAANAEVDQMGFPVVKVELTAEGAAALLKVTSANVGKLVAFVIDGKVEMAPMVREPIDGGRLFITADHCPEDDPAAVGRALAACLAHPTSATWRRKD